MKLILTDRYLNLPCLQDDVHTINIAEVRIANCVGCFGCWTKTPGKCVIRDDAVNVYPLIAQSNEVLYVSKVKFGGYDTPMKTMLERAIPIQQAFIRLVNGETHHVQRAVIPKRATIVGYGALSDRGENQDISTRMPLPKRIFIAASTRYWEGQGRKNGITHEQMETMEIEKE